MSDFAKIKIKVGSLEVEYEGPPSFLTSGIDSLLDKMGDLAGWIPEETVVAEGAKVEASITPAMEPKTRELSTNTIAAHIGANSGPDLIICAMAQLEILQGKSDSNRTEILQEIKNASNYYNKNMSGNLSLNLKNLVEAKKILERGKDRYALHIETRKEVEGKLDSIT